MSGARRGIAWVIGLLGAGYALKWADAQVLSVVLPQVKAEFRCSDTALGLLIGLPFALFYSVLGVPIARLADRSSRRTIIAWSLALFSGFTALGAASFSYGALFATRIGVGIGEAGASPPAQSLITDLVPPSRRGLALAIYASGLNVGVLAGFVIGGVVGAAYGWRAACLVCGLPGLIVAVLTRLTVPDPPRPRDAVSPIGDVLRTLFGQTAFRALLAGNSLASLAAFSALAWMPSFLARDHGMDARASGLFLGLMTGVLGGVGAVLAGWVADVAERRVRGGRPLVLAICCLVAWPSLLAFYVSPGAALPWWLFITPALLGAAHAGPSAAIVSALVPASMRATALSLLLLVLNVVGTVLGPVLAGALSDWLRPAFGAESLRIALAATSCALPLAAWQFWRCGRTGAAPGLLTTGAAATR